MRYWVARGFIEGEPQITEVASLPPRHLWSWIDYGAREGLTLVRDKSKKNRMDLIVEWKMHAAECELSKRAFVKLLIKRPKFTENL